MYLRKYCNLRKYKSQVDSTRKIHKVRQRVIMTRGNQRDLAREKNQKKKKDAAAGNKEGLTKTQRQERDAQIMREKLAKAKQPKDGGGEG
jgi:isoaspartyl peptidase/L-asparaginase-like protein (Ntn-hydrolase superfamily)